MLFRSALASIASAPTTTTAASAFAAFTRLLRFTVRSLLLLLVALRIRCCAPIGSSMLIALGARLTRLLRVAFLLLLAAVARRPAFAGRALLVIAAALLLTLLILAALVALLGRAFVTTAIATAIVRTSAARATLGAFRALARGQLLLHFRRFCGRALEPAENLADDRRIFGRFGCGCFRQIGRAHV